MMSRGEPTGTVASSSVASSGEETRRWPRLAPAWSPSSCACQEFRRIRRPASIAASSAAEPLSWSSLPQTTSVGMVKAASHAPDSMVGEALQQQRRRDAVDLHRPHELDRQPVRIAARRACRTCSMASRKKRQRRSQLVSTSTPGAAQDRPARLRPAITASIVVRAPSEKPPRSNSVKAEMGDQLLQVADQNALRIVLRLMRLAA